MGVYFGWDGIEDLEQDFTERNWDYETDTYTDKPIVSPEPHEVEILFAVYSCEAYSGHALVLMQYAGRLLEVEASHCSCYGLEGQWTPAPVTWEALALRVAEMERDLDGSDFSPLYWAGAEAREAFRALVKSRVS